MYVIIIFYSISDIYINGCVYTMGEGGTGSDSRGASSGGSYNNHNNSNNNFTTAPNSASNNSLTSNKSYNYDDLYVEKLAKTVNFNNVLNDTTISETDCSARLSAMYSESFNDNLNLKEKIIDLRKSGHITIVNDTSNKIIKKRKPTLSIIVHYYFNTCYT